MFVCHGNICRSPMAEFVMKELARKHGADKNLQIESSATSNEEIGNGVYPPAVQELAKHNISCKGKRARRFTMDDYREFDLVVVMEEYNIRNLMRIIGSDSEAKVWKLLDFTSVPPTQGCGDDISDPWYHGNFEKTYKEILNGCTSLIEYLGM